MRVKNCLENWRYKSYPDVNGFLFSILDSVKQGQARSPTFSCPMARLIIKLQATLCHFLQQVLLYLFTQSYMILFQNKLRSTVTLQSVVYVNETCIDCSVQTERSPSRSLDRTEKRINTTIFSYFRNKYCVTILTKCLAPGC